MLEKTFMEVRCAWCEREGKPSLMRVVPGPPTTSHGICAAHLEILRADLAALLVERKET